MRNSEIDPALDKVRNFRIARAGRISIFEQPERLEE